jgi:hypothetical protein
MVERTVDFFYENGPILHDGNTIDYSGSDGNRPIFLTENCLWMLSVSQNNMIATHTEKVLLLTYYCLGLQSRMRSISNLSHIGIYNPWTNTSTVIDLSKLTCHSFEIIASILNIEDPEISKTRKEKVFSPDELQMMLRTLTQKGHRDIALLLILCARYRTIFIHAFYIKEIDTEKGIIYIRTLLEEDIYINADIQLCKELCNIEFPIKLKGLDVYSLIKECSGISFSRFHEKNYTDYYDTEVSEMLKWIAEADKTI